MEGFIDAGDVTSTGVRRMLDVWNAGRGDLRAMPRSRLNPAAFGDLLAWLFLVEFEFEPFRIRYRIVGSQQARLAGRDFSGLFMEEVHHSPEVKAFATEVYRRMIDTAAPVFISAGFPALDGQEYAYQGCALPVGDDTGATITHALGFEDLRFLEPGNVLPAGRDYERMALERARKRPVRRTADI